MKKGESPGRICRMEEVTVIKAVTLQDHAHIYVSILPGENVTKQVKWIFDKYLDFWRKHNRYLLPGKCYRGMAGNLNGETIRKDIGEQLRKALEK